MRVLQGLIRCDRQRVYLKLLFVPSLGALESSDQPIWRLIQSIPTRHPTVFNFVQALGAFSSSSYLSAPSSSLHEEDLPHTAACVLARYYRYHRR